MLASSQEQVKKLDIELAATQKKMAELKILSAEMVDGYARLTNSLKE